MTDAKDVSVNAVRVEFGAYCHPFTNPIVSVEGGVMVEVRLALEVIRLRAEVANLTRKRDALTMHMNQVHDTLGGTDTVLTLEAAQHVVFERDALKTQLAAERMSLLAMELSRDKRLERARSTIALFASVIKSGEPWTTSCEEALTAAFTQEDA